MGCRERRAVLLQQVREGPEHHRGRDDRRHHEGPHEVRPGAQPEERHGSPQPRAEQHVRAGLHHQGGARRGARGQARGRPQHHTRREQLRRRWRCRVLLRLRHEGDPQRPGVRRDEDRPVQPADPRRAHDPHDARLEGSEGREQGAARVNPREGPLGYRDRAHLCRARHGRDPRHGSEPQVRRERRRDQGRPDDGQLLGRPGARRLPRLPAGLVVQAVRARRVAQVRALAQPDGQRELHGVEGRLVDRELHRQLRGWSRRVQAPQLRRRGQRYEVRPPGDRFLDQHRVRRDGEPARPVRGRRHGLPGWLPALALRGARQLDER